MTHQDGPDCPGCEAKLLQALPYLSNWFKTQVKPKYPEAHVSWSYRDQVSQEEAFTAGKSKLHYPESAHNHTEDGSPLSYALDLFQIIHGVASWAPGFFNSVAHDCEEMNLPIFWGGRFKTLGDADHYQYQEKS